VQILLEECSSLFVAFNFVHEAASWPFGLVFHRVLRAYPTWKASDSVIIYAAAFQFRLCCSAKSSPELPERFNERIRDANPNAAKITEPTGKKSELHYVPSGSGQERPGTGAYIDTEGPRIENKPERACGTNG
jgi:hypothetical protein